MTPAIQMPMPMTPDTQGRLRVTIYAQLKLFYERLPPMMTDREYRNQKAHNLPIFSTPATRIQRLVQDSLFMCDRAKQLHLPEVCVFRHNKDLTRAKGGR